MGNHNYRNKQQKQTLTHHPTKLETNQLPKPTGLATGSHFVLMSSNYRESVDTDMYSTCIFGIGCFYLESWFIKLPGVYTTCVVSLICSLTYNMQLLLTRTNFFIDIFFIVVEQYRLQQHDPYSTLLLWQGYIGGSIENPSFEQVCSNTSGHLQGTFNKISLLLGYTSLCTLLEEKGRLNIFRNIQD